MSRKQQITWLCLIFLLTIPGTLQAQQANVCAQTVQQALTSTDEACVDTGRNQACYGNTNLEAQPQAGFPDLTFSEPGDIVDLGTVQTLRLDPLDSESETWGIALMRLQANLPATLPGQNVNFLLFGNVEIENAVTEDAESDLAPMQAFYLRTGFGDALCEEAPDSGLLVQRPQGASEIEFTVNEVHIRLASTAYLQNLEGSEMAINTIEGSAQVTAQGVTSIAVAGTRVRVPLDADGLAAGPPTDPEPYEDTALQALPVGNLDREIEIAPALTPEEIGAAPVTAVPTAGEWEADFIGTGSCADTDSIRWNISLSEDGETMSIVPVEDSVGSEVLGRSETGEYILEAEGFFLSLQIETADYISGFVSLNFGDETAECDMEVRLLSASE